MVERIKHWAAEALTFVLMFLIVCSIWVLAVLFLYPLMLLERLIGMEDKPVK